MASRNQKFLAVYDSMTGSSRTGSTSLGCQDRGYLCGKVLTRKEHEGAFLGAGNVFLDLGGCYVIYIDTHQVVNLRFMHSTLMFYSILIKGNGILENGIWRTYTTENFNMLVERNH